ncbi:aldehyde dehydrogenase [Verrucomicrobiota bacterium]|jgi:aldehyde dehydrogenase (NAD+)|nr:aldehyde dehydrogenase [Verrucomicrobiota bacterium]
MAARLPITKTPKCYVGGAFIRSESGRVTALHDSHGDFFANIPQCTRKDLRNAVEAAAKAGPGWAKRSGYNRGQILYRLAEMIEARGSEMAEAIALGGASDAAATKEVSASIERLIHYAGWADKFVQVLGSVNPVSSPHFNFTVTEPMGIVGVIAPDEAPLLALVSLIAPAIAGGNSVVALASQARPYPAIVLGEMLATSDLPGGVVNILTGQRSEMLPTFATHEHLRALSGVANADERKQLRLGAAESVRRTRLQKSEDAPDWFADSAQGVHEIRELIEFKTTWHPIGA